MSPDGFALAPYPYDRLGPLAQLAAAHPGGAVDLSIGTPTDPPAAKVLAALAGSGAERGYPPSVGSEQFRRSATGWMRRRLGVEVDPDHVGVCMGTKELVAQLPGWLRLRRPQRDTVLYPAVSYPTYAMGATLARCRAVPVAVDDNWRLRLESVVEADAERALCLWTNSPANPTGAVDDLGAAAAWGRRYGVPVISDECYVEFTWSGPPETVLSHGSAGVLAVHSLSKRSNLAGLRAGFYAGDEELVDFLREVRKHAGFMVPGPVQAAAAVALDDDTHVEVQRQRYSARLARLAELLQAAGARVRPPEGTFYLWAQAPTPDAWSFARALAANGGMLVAPGDLYGPAGAGYVRVAAVASTELITLVARRMGLSLAR
ncbi:MAG: aminotransferase class I/II-fold pyridoxal phosphate-dependent enzyme [Acidimicrobiales bacterium]